jgi:hypothetical protein
VQVGEDVAYRVKIPIMRQVREFGKMWLIGLKFYNGTGARDSENVAYRIKILIM